MSTHEKSRPLGKGGSPENDASNVTSQDTAVFVPPAGGKDCSTYYVRLCDGLAERLEDLANRRGVLLEDLAAELIEDGLIRASLTESLLTSWEARS
ncbi:hypothetical protein [Streptomyces spinosisporus]|uniref:CopG family transcriptional regulator n=1 Tax=Streptomyces spinosisporus TaxID=2927582 RepID=A0ABS9X810_9ACTN|nr:hypothetical protein [Streptomyces spinosisporus]MCI3238213.1 hypothetical protein [Streptomyces spinosisporus]